MTQPRPAQADSAYAQVAENHYYIEYPENLPTQYTVYVAATPETIAWCEEQREAAAGVNGTTFDRIARGHALYRGIRARRALDRNIATGGAPEPTRIGFYGNPDLKGRSDSEIIHESAKALALRVFFTTQPGGGEEARTDG